MEHTPDIISPEEEKFAYYQRDLRLTNEQLHKPLLDVGTGPGDFVKYLRNTLGNQDAWGVEYSRRRIRESEDGVINADGFSLPFQDETFFTVTAHNYLPMFVEDPEEMQQALWELIRVAQHGGTISGDIETPEGAAQFVDEAKHDTKFEGALSQAEDRYRGALVLKDFLENIAVQGYGISVHTAESGNHILTIAKP